MSQSVAGALEVISAEKSRETRLFIRTIDKFFDCLNGRSTQAGKRSRNPNVDPYASSADERFKVLLGKELQLHVLKRTILLVAAS